MIPYRLEERLLAHANFILNNAKKMIEDTSVRGALRNFDERSYVYWSHNTRKEMRRGKMLTK